MVVFAKYVRVIIWGPLSRFFHGAPNKCLVCRPCRCASDCHFELNSVSTFQHRNFEHKSKKIKSGKNSILITTLIYFNTKTLKFKKVLSLSYSRNTEEISLFQYIDTIPEIWIFHRADFKYQQTEFFGSRFKSVRLWWCPVPGQYKSSDFWHICGQKSKQRILMPPALFIQECKVTLKPMTFTFCCP